MADRGRGGYRQPAKPAAVSNPQSGARTDGGAGSKSQPLRAPTGGAYGARKATIDQQKGAPLADNTKAGASPTGGAPSAGGQPAGAFGPTQRPLEPNDAGLNPQATNPAAASPQAALRAIYAKFPHPAISRLIDWSATGGRGPSE